MNKLTLEHIQALYLKLCIIFGDKFNRKHDTKAFIELWWNEWLLGLAGINPLHFENAISECRKNLDWPPSIAEFRRYCERSDGYPTVQEAFKAAISRNFYHPIIQKSFDKIGSWDMRHGLKIDLEKRFNAAYTEALAEMRQELCDQNSIEHVQKISSIEDLSHGREVERGETRGSGLQQAAAYLPRR